MRRLNKPVLTFILAFNAMILGITISDTAIYNIMLKLLDIFKYSVTSEQITIYFKELMPHKYIISLVYGVLFWLFTVSIIELLFEIFDKSQD